MPIFTCPKCHTPIVQTTIATYAGCEHVRVGQTQEQRKRSVTMALKLELLEVMRKNKGGKSSGERP